MLTSTIDNLNGSFSLCDLDGPKQASSSCSINNVSSQSANLFSDNEGYANVVHDQSSFEGRQEPSSSHQNILACSSVIDSSQNFDPAVDASSDQEKSTLDPSDSDSDFDLPNRVAPKKRKLSLGHALQDKSAESNIFEETVNCETEMVELGKTQKKGLSLTVKSGGFYRILSIAPAGVGKKCIKWRCIDRKCKGSLVTKIPSSLVSSKISGKTKQRKRFALIDQNSLVLDHLDPKKETPHTCEQVLDKTIIVNRITNEAQKLIKRKAEESKDSARLLTPQNIIREATKIVVDTLDQDELSRNRINAKRFDLPRRIHRLIQAVKPTNIDVNKENIADFSFPDSLQEGSFRIDLDLAEATENKLLLFTCPEISWLQDPSCTVLFDGTFIIQKTPRSTYAQVWIIYGCCEIGSQMIGYCFMSNRQKITYDLVLSRLQERLGELEVHTVIMDQEQAMNSAVTEHIKHKFHKNCCFHKISCWRKWLTKKLGALMPQGRNRPESRDSENLLSIWKHVKLTIYFPHQFGQLYLSYLNSVTSDTTWDDQQSQIEFMQILTKIQKDFADHPSFSWYEALTTSETPVWADATSNRVERQNLEINNYISKHCSNTSKQIEVILSMKEYADLHRCHALVFDTNSVGRRPHKSVLERRTNIVKILNLLKQNDLSLNAQREVYNLIKNLRFY